MYRRKAVYVFIVYVCMYVYIAMYVYIYSLLVQDYVYHDFPVILKRFVGNRCTFVSFRVLDRRQYPQLKTFWATDYMISWGFSQEIVNVNYFKRDYSYSSSKKLWSYLTSFWSPTRICKSFKCYQIGTSVCKTISCFPGWSPWWSQLPGKASKEPDYRPFWGMWWRGKFHFESAVLNEHIL